jgi:hypothetical protein
LSDHWTHNLQTTGTREVCLLFFSKPPFKAVGTAIQRKQYGPSIFDGASPHALKPLYGQFACRPGVGPFYESEEAVPDRLHAALVTRIVTVNDDVTGAQFDPVANLAIEVVHDSFCFAVC